MSDLIVVGFDSTDEADKVLLKLNSLKKEYLIDLEDAVVVVRDGEGNLRPSFRRALGRARRLALLEPDCRLRDRRCVWRGRRSPLRLAH
jgi:hypothetical protein